MRSPKTVTSSAWLKSKRPRQRHYTCTQTVPCAYSSAHSKVVLQSSLEYSFMQYGRLLDSEIYRIQTIRTGIIHTFYKNQILRYNVFTVKKKFCNNEVCKKTKQNELFIYFHSQADNNSLSPFVFYAWFDLYSNSVLLHEMKV